MPELQTYSADLHIHSRYSGATSQRMDINTIAQQASLKGLALVGTGDVFHPRWFESIKTELEEVAEGIFEHPRYRTRFILTVEVEDKHRVHHLILLPSLAAVESVREELAKHSSDIDTDGRARVDLAAPEIVDITLEHNCLIGPSHAFTPWTSMYKEFDSMRACYGDRTRDVKFLELGLSADTSMADRIAELQDITFLSCSDAHCLHPDTKIFLSDGRSVWIKELTEADDVLSVDFDGYMKLRNSKPIRLVKRPAPKFLFEVKTSLGSIRATPEHRFFVFKSETLVEKPAADLRKGDLVAGVRRLKLNGKPYPLPQLKLRRYYGISSEGLNYLRKKRIEIGQTQEQMAKDLGIHELSFLKIEKGKTKCRETFLRKMCSRYKLRFEDFLKEFVVTIFPPIRAPLRTTSELCQFLGYIVGDGGLERGKRVRGFSISDKHERLLAKYQKLSEKIFGVTGRLEKSSKRSPRLRFPSYLLDYLQCIESSILTRSKDRRIPKLVFSLPDAQIGAFLRGLFDAEGTVGHHWVNITSSSLRLIEDVQALLLRLEIRSYLYPYHLEKRKGKYRHRLFIYGQESLTKFHSKIGFSCEEKEKKLVEILSRFKQDPKEAFVDYLPLKETICELKDLLNIPITRFPKKLQFHLYGDGSTLRTRHVKEFIEIFKRYADKNQRKRGASIFLQKLRKLVDGDVIFVPVLDINSIRADCDYVYDLTVPGYENYIANGLVVHNSPWPDKLGREFNRFELAEPTYAEIVKAINRESGRRISLNVGFDPRLGKYHRTACSRCFKQFELWEAKEFRWRCDVCGGWIKKGVWDRINELADYPEPKHPPHRPGYLRTVPLAEVIALATGYKNSHEPEVQSTWQRLVARFGNEIAVLVDVPLEALLEAVGPQVTAVVKAFREGSLKAVAGGGGRYGHLEIPAELARTLPLKAQRTLMDFK